MSLRMSATIHRINPTRRTTRPLMMVLRCCMQAVYHVRGLQAEADDGPQGRQMDQRPGHSGRVASWSLKSQGAAVCQASRKSNTANPTASFLGRKGRNSPCKRFGGIEVRWRLRNRSLPRIAQGIGGYLSEGRSLRRPPRRRRCPEAAPGPLPRQLRSMSGQRMLQRIHAAGELYLARGGRLSCSGQAGQAPDLTR